ncbi:dihydrofolate reductase [Gammaproteobacteria bacterium]
MAIVSIISAVARNGVIGREGKMPWYLPSDLGRFKCITNNSPVIMGRRTFDAIGHPLPDRVNIVMTKDRDFHCEGVVVFYALNEALAFAEGNGADEIFIIGGEKLYRDTIGLASRIYLTSMLADYEGDAFFPKIDFSEWHVIFSRYFPETIPHHFVIIERIDAAQKIEIESPMGCGEITQDILGRSIPPSIISNPQNLAFLAETSKHRRW